MNRKKPAAATNIKIKDKKKIISNLCFVLFFFNF